MNLFSAGFVVGLIVVGAQLGEWNYGYGDKSCSFWAQYRRGPSGDISRIANEAWVLGYISGAGLDRKTQKSDTQGLLAAVDKACSENPTDLIVDAARTVFNNLRK
jgi:hypothetical protein